MRSWLTSEDWFAVWLGTAVVAMALPTAAGIDLLGWVASPRVWLSPAEAVRPVSLKYAALPGFASLLFTYLLVLGLVVACATARKIDLRTFIPGFTILFWASVGCWILGHFAYIAQTPDKRAGMGIGWSLGLTGEAGYLVALLAGLLVGNVLPTLAARLKPAARPEWFIKTAIVLLGAGLGVKAAAASGLVTSIMFRGLAAIIEAYLIYWALVYLLARTVFRFSREWAAPLASGISICGVSAAITTGAAIRASRRADHGLLPGGHLLGGGAGDPPARRPRVPLEGTDGGRRLDGPGGQDRRRGGGERRDHRLLDPAPEPWSPGSTTRPAGSSRPRPR